MCLSYIPVQFIAQSLSESGKSLGRDIVGLRALNINLIVCLKKPYSPQPTLGLAELTAGNMSM